MSRAQYHNADWQGCPHTSTSSILTCAVWGVCHAFGKANLSTPLKSLRGSPTIQASFCLILSYRGCLAIVHRAFIQKYQTSQANGMEVDREPKLDQLHRSISALNRSVRQHISELDAAPEHVRTLWTEIEELRILVHHGQSLNMNFDILDAKTKEEAAEIVQNASGVVSSLGITLDTICGHDRAEEITATLGEQECEQYVHNITEYRDKLAATLDLLQMLVPLLGQPKTTSTNANPPSANICDVWQPQCMRTQKLFDISRL